MANCDFLKEIGLVHGTLSKSTHFEKGKKVTKRVVAIVRNGKQRVYIRQSTPRSTPPTEKEIIARARFARMSEIYLSLSDETKHKYAQEMKRAKCKFNGKKYSSLRGYIIARLYADNADQDLSKN